MYVAQDRNISISYIIAGSSKINNTNPSLNTFNNTNKPVLPSIERVISFKKQPYLLPTQEIH
jgi:hypothetical protein